MKPGVEDKTVTEEMLETKVDMCRKYLFVLDRVERGLTKNRGKCKCKMLLTSHHSQSHFNVRSGPVRALGQPDNPGRAQV